MAAGAVSVKPIKKPSGSAVDIGVEIEGVDIENLTGKHITCYNLGTTAKSAQMQNLRSLEMPCLRSRLLCLKAKEASRLTPNMS